MEKYIIWTLVLLFNLNYCLGQEGTVNSGCTTVACHGSVVDNEVVHTAVLDGCDKCHISNGATHPSAGVEGFSLKENVPQLCYSCHDANNTKSNVHPPTAKGECMTCHTPHSSPKYFLLKEDRADKLCAKCHDLAFDQKKNVHKPVAQGKCYKCHDPHDSDNPLLLKKKANALCVKCHKPFKAMLKSEDVIHVPVTEDCVKCHDPHSSDNDHLTRETVPKLCYGCHDPNNTKKNVHAPTAEGKCMTCHTPHSSPKYFLLREETSAELCAKCHDMKMTEKKNVHKPVAQGKCHKCHDPHDSDNPKLLKKKINALCVRCHKPFKAMFKSEDVIHVPVTEDCTKCHDPHSSEMDHLTKEAVPNLCYGCHDPNNTKKNVHDPVARGKCMTCHTPHSSPKYFLLKENPSANLCKKCHVMKIEKKAVQHGPVEIGKCHKCHDPHDSDRDKFLKKPIPKLCLRCHKNIKAQLELKNVHAPFAENCINCHDQIHGSSIKYLFSKEGKDLCLKCHNKQIKTKTGTLDNIKNLLDKKEFLHGAIDKGGCAICHNPHASENPRLLTATFPDGAYAEGKKENFGLCFTCHETDLLEIKTTTTATGFRDGDKNLHFLHVNKEKGRSCTMCHNPHAADNKKMITEKVTFGNWKMPLNYTILDNGGSCRTGCHTERKYER